MDIAPYITLDGMIYDIGDTISKKNLRDHPADSICKVDTFTDPSGTYALKFKSMSTSGGCVIIVI